jgi:hypothetical protein
VKYLVAIMSKESADWYEVEAPTAAEAVSTVKERILGGEALGADVTISAVPMPDKPIRVTRLTDMTEFEAGFRPETP